MRREWAAVLVALCLTLLILAPALGWQASDNRLLVVNDALDPVADLIAPYTRSTIERLTPYRLVHEVPGLEGMALVFSSQARPYLSQSTAKRYVPLYTTTLVIAVNHKGNSYGAIDGWRSLVDSRARVLIPQNATEGGRLAAISLARGLEAAEGDLEPAIEVFARLQSEGRLNGQDEYGFPGHNHVYLYDPGRVSLYDAVVLWDYQAAALMRISGEWEIIVPVEGAFRVDCGFVTSRSAAAEADLRRVKGFLQSGEGQLSLRQAGLSPLGGTPDLTAWDPARLTYNAAFRRSVLSVKLRGPASVLERLLMQGGTLLVFCVAVALILRRIPPGLYYVTSAYTLSLVLLWMIIGVVKTLSLDPHLTRYCWYATYLPRHALPFGWYCMSYVNRNGRLPDRKSLHTLGLLSLLLTVFVFTNDLHQQVFIHLDPDPSTWANRYGHAWGYYLSIGWSIVTISAGTALLFRRGMTRRQGRQLFYAGASVVALLTYQLSYLAGVRHALDLDIPTTVALLMLVFLLAEQRERFMGASLLTLPVFRSSPHAIAVYDQQGQVAYSNAAMAGLGPEQEHAKAVALSARPGDALLTDVVVGDRAYSPHLYALDHGRAIVLEDITSIRRLERSLRETHHKLRAIGMLLVRQAGEAQTLTSSLEQERYSGQINSLLTEKLATVELWLNRAAAPNRGHVGQGALRRIRFVLSICQQRLRFVIRSLEAHPHIPAQLVADYAAQVMAAGQRLGLDGVVTGAICGDCPLDVAGALLESLDCICLSALDRPGSSLICRIEGDDVAIALHALLSLADGEDATPTLSQDLPCTLIEQIAALGGRLSEEIDDDTVVWRLRFRYARPPG